MAGYLAVDKKKTVLLSKLVAVTGKGSNRVNKSRIFLRNGLVYNTSTAAKTLFERAR